MIEQSTTSPGDNSPSKDQGNEPFQEPKRDEERGEVSEPDAPTSGKENDGMNTILDGGLGTGVQNDAVDEE